jgi:hypothetical protein
MAYFLDPCNYLVQYAEFGGPEMLFASAMHNMKLAILR